MQLTEGNVAENKTIRNQSMCNNRAKMRGLDKCRLALVWEKFIHQIVFAVNQRATDQTKIIGYTLYHV